MVNASQALVWSFVGLALLLASVFVLAVRRAAIAHGHSPSTVSRPTAVAGVATVAWLGLTMVLAAGGVLSFSARPPTMLALVAAILGLAFALGTSRIGSRLATGIPLAALVGIQGFRFPLELMLHQAYVEGLMPVQMSYTGFNFDIISGLSAILVAAVVVRRPGSLVLVRIWNTAGIVLLVNILVIALLSAPTPFRVFYAEPANVWITQAPWVWLVSVYVLAAILGHILVYRRLRHEAAQRSGARVQSAGGVATRPV